MTETGDLRDELGAVPDPDFDIVPPPGWVRYENSQEQQDAILRQVKQRLMHAHRPDMFAHMRHLLEQAWDGMRRTDVVAWYGPGADAPESAAWPASMTASIRRAPHGGTLDSFIRQAITELDATPLFDDKRFIRFERESTERIQTETVSITTIAYVTPVPLTNRRRGLQLTATIAKPPGTPTDDAPVQAMRAAFDLCASSLTWKPPEGYR